MPSGLPFDDFRDLMRRMPAPDAAARQAAADRRARLDAQGTVLGRVGDVAVWLAGWRASPMPAVQRPLVALFAGTHGVNARLHGAGHEDEIRARVEFCAAGGAAVNQVCAANDLGLKVFDLALHMPVADITQAPALDERGCAATMAFGMEAIAGGADLVCVGDLGAGNEISAAALLAALLGGAARDWLANDGDAGLADAALDLHQGHLGDAFETLRRLGGREFAAIAGAILAARMERVPVILGGMATLASAAVLHAIDPRALDHCLLGHAGADPAQDRAAEALGLSPLLQLGLGDGEGLGAALGAVMVKNAAGIHAGMTLQEPAAG